MVNLDLIQNSTTATLEGTLLGTLDYCVTPFGTLLFLNYFIPFHKCSSVAAVNIRAEVKVQADYVIPYSGKS